MSSIKTFRDLIAWQKAMELAYLIYQATRQMPSKEQFGLTRQMRRAAVSIPSNIAEGYAQQKTASYLKYLRIARGSLAELMTQFDLVLRLQMLSVSPTTSDLLSETDRVLQGLIRSLERK